MLPQHFSRQWKRCSRIGIGGAPGPTFLYLVISLFLTQRVSDVWLPPTVSRFDTILVMGPVYGRTCGLVCARVAAANQPSGGARFPCSLRRRQNLKKSPRPLRFPTTPSQSCSIAPSLAAPSGSLSVAPTPRRMLFRAVHAHWPPCRMFPDDWRRFVHPVGPFFPWIPHRATLIFRGYTTLRRRSDMRMYISRTTLRMVCQSLSPSRRLRCGP